MPVSPSEQTTVQTNTSNPNTQPEHEASPTPSIAQEPPEEGGMDDTPNVGPQDIPAPDDDKYVLVIMDILAMETMMKQKIKVEVRAKDLDQGAKKKFYVAKEKEIQAWIEKGVLKPTKVTV